jgi:putative ABC transport system permease protein
MWKKIFISFSLAHHNLKLHILHTLLSILGIVIGVAALVSVLSLIDGLEKYALEEITKTTSLKAIMIQTNMYESVNNVRLKKEDYNFLNYNNFSKLISSLSEPAQGYLSFSQPEEVTVSGSVHPIGAFIIGTTEPRAASTSINFGRYFSDADVAAKINVAYVNHYLAKNVMKSDSVHKFIGRTITFKDREVKVIGILKSDNNPYAEVFVPITLFTDEELKENPPKGILEAGNLESISSLKVQAENWLTNHFHGDTTDFMVITNELRVEQAISGLLIFRIVMGAIVGISVVVGGIGIMNVMLITVNERTVEIGVRKAMGAKRKDIMLHFLAEAITVSFYGSLLGLLFGIITTIGIVAIVKTITQVPFQTVFTLETFGTISILSILIGVIFGTYPAFQAAKLDPIEAIRRE